MATHKLCPRCGIEKPISQFGKSARNKDGLSSWCKACKKADSDSWYARNKGRRRETAVAWNAAHVDELKEYRRNYYQANRAKYDAYVIQWYKEHPELNRAQARRDYHRHRAKRIARFKKWREQNKGQLAESNRAWREANVALCRANSRNYKARKKGAVGTHTAEDIADIRQLQDDRCAMPFCCKPLNGKGHVDHIIALVNGGRNDRQNLQLLCPRCNMRKHDKDHATFLRENGLI